MAKELSIFVDESGDRGGKARYYPLVLVFHDQEGSIAVDLFFMQVIIPESRNSL